jgi:hypothetical protein
MAYRPETSDSTASILNLLRDIAAALNPVTLWEAFNEADEGVCLMEPVRIRTQRRR